MIPGSLHNSDYKDKNDKSDIENREIDNIGNNKLTKINNKILRPNFSENFATRGASPLLAELAETCNKVGKNTGGTNQSLSESLVAQTIILDEQNRRFQQQI